MFNAEWCAPAPRAQGPSAAELCAEPVSDNELCTSLTVLHEKEQICVFFYAQTVSETQRRALWRAHRLEKLHHYMQPNVAVLGIDEPTVGSNGRKPVSLL